MLTDSYSPAIQAFLWSLSDLSQLQNLTKRMLSSQGFDWVVSENGFSPTTLSARIDAKLSLISGQFRPHNNGCLSIIEWISLVSFL